MTKEEKKKNNKNNKQLHWSVNRNIKKDIK
jgi:hypothetical protein